MLPKTTESFSLWLVCVWCGGNRQQWRFIIKSSHHIRLPAAIRMPIHPCRQLLMCLYMCACVCVCEAEVLVDVDWCRRQPRSLSCIAVFGLAPFLLCRTGNLHFSSILSSFAKWFPKFFIIPHNLKQDHQRISDMRQRVENLALSTRLCIVPLSSYMDLIVAPKIYAISLVLKSSIRILKWEIEIFRNET